MSSMQSVIFVFVRVDLIEISSDTNHIIYGLLSFELIFFYSLVWNSTKSSNINCFVQTFYNCIAWPTLFWHLVEALF